MFTKITAFVLGFAAYCCLSNDAAAQVSMHWGTFSIGAPAHCGGHNWCSSVVGPDAMRREGLKVSNSGGTPVGQGNNITVIVLCHPQGNDSGVAVVASSTNSATAERFRNAVRTHMTGARCL